MSRRRRGLLAALAAAAVVAAPVRAEAPRLPWRLVATYPHDPAAFTQGLLYHQGYLYESTGLRGRSELRRVDVDSGRVLARRALPPELFGEGLARVGERLIQLTWQAGLGIVYRLEDLAPIDSFRYLGEGWGLAYDGRYLYMSDGSAVLRVLDPERFLVLRRLQVRQGAAPVARLNELEFVEGQLFANVWRRDRIARIDPATGNVTGWLDLSGLLAPAERVRADVLNGMAWDPDRRRLLVTGKLWPRVFALELGDRGAAPPVQ